MIAFVSEWCATVCFCIIPFALHQLFRAPFLNSPPQSAWIALTFFPPVASSISLIACFKVSVVSLLAHMGMAIQYQEKSSIMVKTYFFPSHSVSIGPIRFQCIRSRISCIRMVMPLSLAPGFVDFPFIHVTHSALANSPGGMFMASGSFLRAGNERCPYLL